MTIGQALSKGRNILNSLECGTIALDVSLLLAHAMKISREELYMKLPEELPAEQERCFIKLLERRRNNEPVAWIVGRKEFWGRNFKVGPGVLTPRPDSEVLIEKALE